MMQIGTSEGYTWEAFGYDLRGPAYLDSILVHTLSSLHLSSEYTQFTTLSGLRAQSGHVHEHSRVVYSRKEPALETMSQDGNSSATGWLGQVTEGGYTKRFSISRNFLGCMTESA